MAAGVYKIQCLENGKCYIGSAESIKNRKATHLSMLMCNKHRSRSLQDDFNAGNHFSFETLRLCDIKRERLYYEHLAIDIYDSINNGYNTVNVLKYSVPDEIKPIPEASRIMEFNWENK